MQSLAIPTSVAWQPSIYLKGRPHSNAYHQPALPAWCEPLSSVWLPHPPRHIALSVPGLRVHATPIIRFLATVKAPGDSGPHFNNELYFFGRVESSHSVHRSCQLARLKSLLCLGPPSNSHFMGTYA